MVRALEHLKTTGAKSTTVFQLKTSGLEGEERGGGVEVFVLQLPAPSSSLTHTFFLSFFSSTIFPIPPSLFPISPQKNVTNDYFERRDLEVTENVTYYSIYIL